MLSWKYSITITLDLHQDTIQTAISELTTSPLQYNLPPLLHY